VKGLFSPSFMLAAFQKSCIAYLNTGRTHRQTPIYRAKL